MNATPYSFPAAPPSTPTTAPAEAEAVTEGPVSTSPAWLPSGRSVSFEARTA